MKFKKTFLIILVLMLAWIFGFIAGIVVYSSERATVVQMNPDRWLIKKALAYHGIETAHVSSDGVYYFIRNNKWCALFNNRFRNYMAEKFEQRMGGE